MTDAQKELDSKVHIFCVRNTKSEIGDAAARKNELKMLENACENLKTLNELDALEAILQDATNNISAANKQDLKDVLKTEQQRIQAKIPTVLLTKQTSSKIKIGEGWQDKQVEALQNLIQSIKNDEKAIKARQGVGYQGTVDRANYAGDEEQRRAGGFEAFQDCIQSLAFNTDKDKVWARLLERKNNHFRMARAIISIRPAYSDHKVYGIPSARLSLTFIKSYASDVTGKIAGAIKGVIKKSEGTRKKCLIWEDDDGELIWLNEDGNEEKFFTNRHIVDIIFDAEAALQSIHSQMNYHLDAYEDAQNRHKAGDKSATGDINNLAMVRYDAQIISATHRSQFFRVMLNKYVENNPLADGEVLENKEFPAELTDIMRNLLDESLQEEFDELAGSKPSYNIIIGFILLCRDDHDSIFTLEKLRFDRNGLPPGKWPVLSAFDAEHGTFASQTMSYLFGATRARQDNQWHVPFPSLTWHRIERMISIVSPLVSVFGYIMSCENKLMAIANIATITGPTDELKYCVHQLLACNYQQYLGAKFGLKSNLFDSIEVVPFEGKDPTSSDAAPKSSSSSSKSSGVTSKPGDATTKAASKALSPSGDKSKKKK